ncbi:MAG: alpha/beta hydrolase [Nitrospirota bacterium]|nr:alpha/beta hydrolase [Nitrospirota bacterium]
MAFLSKKRPGLKRMLITVVIGLALGYFGLVAFVYVRQPKMLYFPTKEIEQTPAAIGLSFDEVTFKTSDGMNIAAWYIPAPDAMAVLLFCHGNGGNISHRLDSIRIFHNLGLSVLIFDYRGYGRSEGEPTEKGTYLDAEAAWNFLVKDKGIDSARIVIFGRSLGSAVAAELAMRRQAGALILESGFTSITDLGRKYYPHMPVSLITRFHYATIDKVSSLALPKLFIHSPSDEVIPYEQGLRLYEKAAEPKEFLQLRGDHNEGFLLSGELYINGLQQFISKYF